jgi:hypothetical protein
MTDSGIRGAARRIIGVRPYEDSGFESAAFALIWRGMASVRADAVGGLGIRLSHR